MEPRFLESITGRLFKVVFGGYLILAIAVTAVQLIAEYQITQRQINNDLNALSLSFRESVSRAAWDLDYDLLNVMAKGLSLSAIVTGVTIISDTGETYASVGVTPSITDYRSGSFFIPFQFAETTLSFQSAKGIRNLGKLIVYSDRSVAMRRVLNSFIVILINSVIKTAGLWLIFYLAISRSLSRPLSQLAEVVSRIEFVAAAKEIPAANFPDYPHQDELGRLLSAMHTMQRRLFSAHDELQKINASLEMTIAERTEYLAEALEWNEKILLNSPIPMGVYLATGQCVIANEAYARFVGATREALLAQNFHEMTSWRNTTLIDDYRLALAHRETRQHEAEVTTSFGKTIFFEYRMVPLGLKGQDHLLIQFTDLAERRRMEEGLRYIAFHDALTQLPNRRVLLDRLQHALIASKRQNSCIAVLFIDLDRFKRLNDTHGHQVGDRLLIEVARRLRLTVRATDTVARIGGDEFVVLIEDLSADLEQAVVYAHSVAEKIRAALSADYILGDIRHAGSASVGSRLVCGGDGDPHKIIEEADADMYEAKKGIAR